MQVLTPLEVVQMAQVVVRDDEWVHIQGVKVENL